MVDGAQRRLGCRLGRQPAAAEGAAGEPAADPAAAARLPPAARSWLRPALVAGEPVAPPPPLLRQGPCRRLLALAAMGSALASPVPCPGRDRRAGRSPARHATRLVLPRDRRRGLHLGCPAALARPEAALLYRSTVLRHRPALTRPPASGRSDRLGSERASCSRAARGSRFGCRF